MSKRVLSLEVLATPSKPRDDVASQLRITVCNWGTDRLMGAVGVQPGGGLEVWFSPEWIRWWCAWWWQALRDRSDDRSRG